MGRIFQFISGADNFLNFKGLKFGTVEAASRRKILKETPKLVNDSPITKHLSMYNEKLQKIKLLKFNWKKKKRQEELRQQGLSEKAAQFLQKESSKNKILRTLKEDRTIYMHRRN